MTRNAGEEKCPHAIALPTREGDTRETRLKPEESVFMTVGIRQKKLEG